MPVVYSSEAFDKYIPESYLPAAANVVSFFKPERVTVDATVLQLELDEDGLSSILRLVDQEGKPIIPYIDLSRYDGDSRDWLWYDSTGFTYRYKDDELKGLYPTNYSGVTAVTKTLQFSPSGVELFSNFRAYLCGESVRRTFYKHAPLIVTIDNEPLHDVSDYVGFLISDRLNKIDRTSMEFYYDFSDRIYTNQNLAGLNPKSIKVHYLKSNDSTLSVKCRLSSNTGGASHYTPMVDSYVVKLRGQNLRV